MRILVLGPNYFPEQTAVAPFTTGLCEHLVSQGHEVRVITAFPYYPQWRVWDEYRGHLWQEDVVANVPLLRVWHFVPPAPGKLLQRLAFDLSFTVSFFLAGIFTGDSDLIYCVCPPPTLALSAYALAKLKRAPYVIKLTDLASDAAVSTGILKQGWKLRAARRLEDLIYDKAKDIVCLCQGFIDRLSAQGVPPEKLHLISDWGDTEYIRPIPADGSFRSEHNISPDRFLVLHTGNMGRKQDLGNVLRAAEQMRDYPEITWVLVGNGEERARLEKEIALKRLQSVKMLPLQPAAKLPQMYAAADVLLLNQKAAVEDAVIPSKLLTYMAAGRAILAAVSERSEAARQIARARCGIVTPAESPSALAEAICQLQKSPDLRAELGRNGRAWAEKNYTRAAVLRRYEDFFRCLGPLEERPVLTAEKLASS